MLQSHTSKLTTLYIIRGDSFIKVNKQRTNVTFSYQTLVENCIFGGSNGYPSATKRNTKKLAVEKAIK
jgi:hypothetical protein